MRSQSQIKLAAISEKMSKLRSQAMAVEQKIKLNRAIPAAKKLVGTYQKYRNNFSCPTSMDDYWWIYRFNVSVKGDKLTYIEFQTDKYGEFTYRKKDWPISYLDILNGSDSKWMPCEKREYKAALSKALLKLTNLKEMTE